MELLKKSFDAAFTAPNGMQKLKELILTFAMQGRLVPQNPSDVPASSLLEKIELEQKSTGRKGGAKRPYAAIKPSELAYDLPDSWKWVRLREIADYGGRKNVKASEIRPDTWLLDLEDIEKDTSRIVYRAMYSERQSKSTKRVFKEGDVLYGKLRPYLNKIVVADDEGVCTTEIVPIVPYGGVEPEFIKWLLKRPSFLLHVDSLMYGVKMPRLGTDDAMNSVHPLPPLEEQRRIVAKIDQLMARCDELEKPRTERDRLQVTVHKVACDRLLTAKDPDTFTQSWQFITQHFSELYSVKENVTELRRAVLQLAVMGKLVPQKSKDSPASELVKKIATKKQKLIKEKRIRKPKQLPKITAEEAPHGLPQGWALIRFGELTTEIATGPFGAVIHKSEYIKNGIPLINPSHMINGVIVHNPAVTVTEQKAKELDSHKLFADDIIMARRGEMGRCAVVDEDSEHWLCGTGSFVLRFIPDIDRHYIQILFRTESVQAYLRGKSVGTTMTNLNHGILNKMPLMLPPVPEQSRIVAKVDQLMSLCDTLEQQIDATTQKQTALLNAVINQI